MLCELDQNSEGIVGMCIENRKSESWKRRARVNQIRAIKENEKEKKDKTKGLGSKRLNLGMRIIHWRKRH